MHQMDLPKPLFLSKTVEDSEFCQELYPLDDHRLLSREAFQTRLSLESELRKILFKLKPSFFLYLIKVVGNSCGRQKCTDTDGKAGQSQNKLGPMSAGWSTGRKSQENEQGKREVRLDRRWWAEEGWGFVWRQRLNESLSSLSGVPA